MALIAWYESSKETTVCMASKFLPEESLVARIKPLKGSHLHFVQLLQMARAITNFEDSCEEVERVPKSVSIAI